MIVTYRPGEVCIDLYTPLKFPRQCSPWQPGSHRDRGVTDLIACTPGNARAHCARTAANSHSPQGFRSRRSRFSAFACGCQGSKFLLLGRVFLRHLLCLLPVRLLQLSDVGVALGFRLRETSPTSIDRRIVGKQTSKCIRSSLGFNASNLATANKHGRLPAS